MKVKSKTSIFILVPRSEKPETVDFYQHLLLLKVRSCQLCSFAKTTDKITDAVGLEEG